MLSLQNHRNHKFRLPAEPRTQKRRPPPPPPPPPAPPPWLGANAAKKRRDEISRRDAIALSLLPFGAYIVFSLLKNTVTAPIDKNPNALQTRLRRNEKGQPFIQAKDGDWVLLRSSPVTPGLVLIRDGAGRVFRLPVLGRSQVDLADDMVIMELFGDGKWESSVEQMLYKDEEEVILTEQEFYQLRV